MKKGEREKESACVRERERERERGADAKRDLSLSSIFRIKWNSLRVNDM